MDWFKIVVLVIVGLDVLVQLCRVGKGEHQMTQKPLTNAIAAILNTLLFLGIWFWL